MFISPALAQQVADVAVATDGGGSPLRILMQFFVIFIVFYFFLIRPQQKKLKQHQAMQSAVSRGDTVVTAGGIVGKVIRSNADDLVVEIADGVRVTVLRDRISTMREPIKADAKKDNKSDINSEEVANDNPTKQAGSSGLKDILTKK